MTENHDTPELQQDKRLAALYESIRHAFSSEPYTGRITPYDGKWASELNENDADLDDDRALYEGLKGRRWTEVPSKLVYDLPDGLPLLTDQAFVAFLPVWLVCSLENIDEENEVRNFVVYNFSPRPEMVPDMTWFTLNRVKVLNQEQRETLRVLLMEFTERGTSPFVKALAVKAIALIDDLK